MLNWSDSQYIHISQRAQSHFAVEKSSHFSRSYPGNLSTWAKKPLGLDKLRHALSVMTARNKQRQFLFFLSTVFPGFCCRRRAAPFFHRCWNFVDTSHLQCWTRCFVEDDFWNIGLKIPCREEWIMLLTWCLWDTRKHKWNRTPQPLLFFLITLSQCEARTMRLWHFYFNCCLFTVEWTTFIPHPRLPIQSFKVALLMRSRARPYFCGSCPLPSEHNRYICMTVLLSRWCHNEETDCSWSTNATNSRVETEPSAAVMKHLSRCWISPDILLDDTASFFWKLR